MGRVLVLISLPAVLWTALYSFYISLILPFTEAPASDEVLRIALLCGKV